MLITVSKMSAIIVTFILVGVLSGIVLLCGHGTAPDSRCVRKVRLFIEMLILAVFNTMVAMIGYVIYLKYNDKTLAFDEPFWLFSAFVLISSTVSPIFARMIITRFQEKVDDTIVRVARIDIETQPKDKQDK